MPLSAKVTVITKESDTIDSVFPCGASSVPKPPQVPPQPSIPGNPTLPPPPKNVQVYMFDRPQEGGNPVADAAVKVGYKVQNGALVKNP